MHNATKIILASCMSLAVVAAQGTAMAQRETRSEAALGLFQKGRALMAEGLYAEAAARFEDAQKLDPGAGTMLNIGYCYEKLEKIASAWAMYRAAVAAAQSSGRNEWASDAQRQAVRLEGVYGARVLVHTTAQEPGIAVWIDDAPLAREAWDLPAPITEGPHEVRAVAPERRPWSARFGAADHLVATVIVPGLEPQPSEPHAVERPGERPVPVAASHLGPQKTAALVTGAVGIAGVVAGSVFAVMAKATYDGANCTGNGCAADGLSAQSRAYGEAGVSTALFAAGAVGLAGAAVLWFTAPNGFGNAGVRPGISQTAWSLSFERAW